MLVEKSKVKQLEAPSWNNLSSIYTSVSREIHQKIDVSIRAILQEEICSSIDWRLINALQDKARRR